ncbi:MAG TPA: putative Ig domain-containing protein [Bryobacteraceae bacterium]|nr:putative Ig domain-containing protein [Bryobacteraceae bacterium]
MTRLVPFIILSACLSAGSLSAQSLVLVSGNGQMQGQQALTTQPLVVQANDANGKPLPGVAITWTVNPTQAGGTPNAQLTTGSNGQASTYYLGAPLQSQNSYLSATVTATSKYGSVSFFVVTVPYFGAPPTFRLLKPAPGATLTAAPGSTIPDAVEVEVLAGPGAESNHPIGNVGIQMVNSNDPTLAASAHCNGPGGLAFTDPTTGIAKCDLVVTGAAGALTGLAPNVGEYQNTTSFQLQISQGPTCTYSISPTSHPVSATGGTGSVNVTAATGCGWAATSNVDWITITSGASGTGNGTVAYSVGADASAARSGTLTIAGQTFTVNQGSGNAGALTITTPANLPGGTVNQSYSATLAASGGVPPYTWSISSGALPAGLSLNASTGLISGAATTAGTTSFTATVQDSAGTSLSLVFSLTISASSSTFVITNTSFPNGVINQPYNQALTSSGGVVTPFAPDPVFQVSGGALPGGLSIVRNNDLSFSITGTPSAAGLFNFTLTATDAAGDTAAANFNITITGTPTLETMAVTPGMLSFSVQLGSATAPAPQALSVTGNGGLLAFTSVLTTASGGSWLVIQNSAGNTPGTINVSVTNYANLQAGTYTGTITVSSAASNSPIPVAVTLTVLAAPSLTVTPAQINLSQGQSAGSNVSTQSVQVTDGTVQGTSGNIPVAFSVAAATNKGGNWLTVSSSTGTTPATLTVSIDSGGLAIGTYAGTITITPTSGAVQLVTVTLNVINPQMLTASPAPVAFTYSQGAPAPAAQSVTVSSSTGPALSLSTAVSTTDKGNWLFVNPSSGITPLDLSVSVNPAGLAPNTYTGTITVTASDDSVTPLPIPVTLTVVPPEPTIGSVVNAASSAPGPIAPGEFVTIFGSGLGPATPVSATAGSATISPNLGGTQVFFGTNAAPILYTSAGQVNVIVPYELDNSSSTNLTVWYQGTASAGDDLRVIDAVPGIFMLNAAGQGAIVNQDGTINSATNGAPVGSIVSIYGTGQGQTNPPGIDGAISTQASPQPPPLPVTVQIGGLPATVSYAGAAPGAPAGFMQVNAMVPAGVPAGTNVPVQITVGTASSQAGVTMYIHP